MLITAMDADPAEEEDFSKWYDREHIIERVAIAGFLEARRYIAVLASPKYLNFYSTENLETVRPIATSCKMRHRGLGTIVRNSAITRVPPRG
jgi:hypothetical protein